MAKPHSELVKVCLNWLSLKGIMAWPNNTGAVKKGKSYIRFGKEGSSDIIGVLPGGRFLGVECKIGRDKVSDAQLVFERDVRRAGGIAITVWCLEHLQEALSGVAYSANGREGVRRISASGAERSDDQNQDT